MQKRQIFFLSGILGFIGVAVAQTVEPPPVKMGLWQTTMTSTITGIQVPPDVAAQMKAMGRPLPSAQPRTTVSQSCATPKNWKDIFQHLQRLGSCKLTNQRLTSSSLAADISCKSNEEQYSSTGHVDIRFPTEEKMHGKMHVETVMEAQPRPIVSDMSFDSAYQGADCQGVSPDSVKIIR